MLQSGHECCLLPCQAGPVQTREPGVQLDLRPSNSKVETQTSDREIRQPGRCRCRVCLDNSKGLDG